MQRSKRSLVAALSIFFLFHSYSHDIIIMTIMMMMMIIITSKNKSNNKNKYFENLLSMYTHELIFTNKLSAV